LKENEGYGSYKRTYVNNVVIKVLVSDVINTGFKYESKKKEYLEQKFKVNSKTSFMDMLLESSDFWCLDSREYTLVPSNMNDVMLLTKSS
jgi:hypothetical protein